MDGSKDHDLPDLRLQSGKYCFVMKHDTWIVTQILITWNASHGCPDIYWDNLDCLQVHVSFGLTCRWSSKRPGVAITKLTPFCRRSASPFLLAPPITIPNVWLWYFSKSLATPYVLKGQLSCWRDDNHSSAWVSILGNNQHLPVSFHLYKIFTNTLKEGWEISVDLVTPKQTDKFSH